MFRHRPSLAAELLTDTFGLPVPDHDSARLGSAELTPIEHRADAVVELCVAGRVALAVIVEVQLSRDAAKRFSWPVYLTTVRARLRCPAALLVICPKAPVAAWCATPIDLGPPENQLRVVVLGPRDVPALTDRAQAEENPELAVLSALAHRTRRQVLAAFPAALGKVDAQHAKLY